MVLGTVAVFLLIRHHGETLVAPPAPGGPTVAVTSSRQSEVLLHLLVALAAIVLAGQLCARLFVRLGQPPVIGEVVAGIFLGPSLLGPDVSALVLPPSVAPFLGVIAQLGVILYMFLVGLELNLGRLRRRSHATVAISHASILAPFILGATAALGPPTPVRRYAVHGLLFHGRSDVGRGLSSAGQNRRTARWLGRR
jgi:hypothetical protein